MYIYVYMHVCICINKYGTFNFIHSISSIFKCFFINSAVTYLSDILDNVHLFNTPPCLDFVIENNAYKQKWFMFIFVVCGIV